MAVTGGVMLGGALMLLVVAAQVDSAGVPVVVHADPALAEVPRHALAQPILELGDGDSAAEIFDRVAGVVLLAGGGIAVGDGRSNEIRVFDADGRHVRTFGRAGGGPGEFSALRGLYVLPGDSLVAWDALDDEVLVFSADGTLARAFDVPRPEGSFGINLRGVIGGIRLWAPANIVVSNPPRGVVHHGEARFHILERDGRHSAELGPFPGTDMYSPPEQPGATMAAVTPDLPFRRELRAAVAGNTIAIGRSDRWSIRVYDIEGRPLRIIRVDRAPVRVRDADRDAFVDEALGRAAERMRPSLRRFFAEAPIPETLPAFGAIAGADDGSLWVADYALPGAEVVRWSVFGPAGELAGTVDTPPALRIMDIRGGRLAGVITDELGVEHVVVYRAPAV